MPRFPSLSLDWSPCSLSSSQTSWWCILRRLFCQPWRLPVERVMTRVHWAWLRNPWIAQELGNPWIARAKHGSILWAAQSMDCPDPWFAHNKFTLSISTLMHTVTVCLLNKIFLLMLDLLLCGALSELTPPAFPAKIVSFQCSQHSHFDEQLTNVLGQIKQQLPVQNASYKSILDNYPSAPSGCYHITTTIIQVYCDMMGPTVEKRKTGWGRLMSTWHNLVLPAHKDWIKEMLVYSQVRFFVLSWIWI